MNAHHELHVPTLGGEGSLHGGLPNDLSELYGEPVRQNQHSHIPSHTYIHTYIHTW